MLRATCLDADLAQLPQRDLTEVGERGVVLSGGQRARLGLARLAYRDDVDTYIIDDPLSALDPRVGRQVFERTLCGMLGGKRRILVTHQLQYLRDAAVDSVAVLAAGRLTACGSYDQVRASGALGSMKTDDATDGGRADADVDADADADADASAAVLVPEPATVQGAGETEVERPQAAEATLAQEQVLGQGGDGAAEAGGEAQHGQDIAAGEPSVLIEAEERITGVVRIATYVGWARAACWPMLVLLMAMLLGAQLLSVLGSVFLPYWGTLAPEAQRRVLRGEGGEWSPLLLGMPWWALLPLTCGFTLLRSELHFRLALRASRRIHEAALQRLLRAPVLFFDANPLGRILNRFSKDVEFCDSLLPATALDVLVCCLLVLASLCLCLAVTPWVAALLLPLVLYFVRLRAFFLAASREIKRLDGLTRSPVFGAFAESLCGTATIRAFDGMATLQMAQFHALHDANSRTYFQFVASARWLGLRLDVICSVLLVFGTLAAVAAKAIGGSVFGGDGNAGLLGAALIFLVRLAGLFQWTVRQTAELENQMVSVERLLSYAKLPQEPPLTSAAPPPAEWPQSGRLTLRNVSMRYRPGLTPALRGVSFEVAAGSLVGVCGRTGAGKSSLLAALFRLSEPHAGTVEIDGVDCGAIGLHELRPKLALIMQSPFLFAGSVADNLSPLGAHTDAQLWQALEHVQLKRLVASFDAGLQTAVADGGTSLSVGERQLLCLARALLLRARLLLLDEATANVDTATDATIQRSVRTHFHDSTVVMIAHRLLTIADVNQVLLLSEGRVFQSGPPAQLLREPPDVARVNFSAMVEDAGLAREAFAPSRQLQAVL